MKLLTKTTPSLRPKNDFSCLISVHNGGRNMSRNAFSAITEHSVCFCKRSIFFSFHTIIKTILLRKCFEYAHIIKRD